VKDVAHMIRIHLKITIHLNLLTTNRFFVPFLFPVEQINKDEFADLCQAIALRFQKEEVVSSHILYFPSLKIYLPPPYVYISDPFCFHCSRLSLNIFRKFTIPPYHNN